MEDVHGQEIDISSSKDFHKFNNTYKAVLKQVKKDGKGTVKHKPPVSNNDMRKIHESGLVDPESPIGLQNKVFLDVMVYFRQRGRVSLRAMTPYDYILSTDSKGKRYFEMKDSLTKNRREDEAKNLGDGCMKKTILHDALLRASWNIKHCWIPHVQRSGRDRNIAFPKMDRGMMPFHLEWIPLASYWRTWQLNQDVSLLTQTTAWELRPLQR